MTHATALSCSIMRCLVVATLAVPLSAALWRFCGTRRSGWRKNLSVALSVAPLFIPDLLVGFTYRLTSARLLHSDAATETLYSGLLLVRVLGLQVAARIMLPQSTVTAESIHSWQLLNRGTGGWAWQWIKMSLLGRYRTVLVAWLAGALFCFQEFETAALVQINQLPIVWTVWLFDAYAAGEPLSLSLQHVGWALAFQLALLSPVAALLRQRRVSGEADERVSGLQTTEGMPDSRRQFIVGTCLLLLVCVTAVLIPLYSNSGQMVSGLRLLVNQGTLLPRIGQVIQSLATSILAAVLALWICRDLLGRGIVSVLFLLPGLCGSLVLSLVMLAVFQLPVLRVAYDTFIPMVITQTLWLMPRACLLLALLRVLSDRESLHSAFLLLESADPKVVRQSRVTLWRLGRVRWLLAASVLTHWSFWDVSIVSLLRPVRFEPIVTRLYNEMHYGRTDTLIAMTVLSFIMPFVVAVIAGLALYVLPLGRRSRG